MRALTARTLVKTGSGLLLMAFIVHVAVRIHAFIGLFYQHAGFTLTQEQVAQYHNASDSRQAYIPKIVHQIYHNWTLPANTTVPWDWAENRQNCIDLNEGWEFKLWHIFRSREFINEYYPWFLPVYDNYPFPVQRIDALRYFLLLHYGGVYLDLDNGCLNDLEPLLYYSTWITDGGCGALSNNILAAEPNHPFWVFLTGSLTSYAWNYFLPYITISYASGQWFITEIWERYHASLPLDDHGLLRLAMDEREGAARWVYFTQERGGTWNNWDNQIFIWIGDHLAISILLILQLIFVFTMILYRIARCIYTTLVTFIGY